jgi:hypothetical protein
LWYDEVIAEVDRMSDLPEAPLGSGPVRRHNPAVARVADRTVRHIGPWPCRLAGLRFGAAGWRLAWLWEANPKFLRSVDGILLIRQEISQSSVSSYWQQREQRIGLGLQRSRLGHLLKAWAGFFRFQLIGHARSTG